MSTRQDWLDRLIDTLLREEVGGERPPDITERVTAAARKRRKKPTRARRWWAWAGGVVAAVLLVGIGFALFGPPRKGELTASGLTVDGGGPLARGATVRTAGGKGTLTLGGYCSVELQANTAVRIDGTAGDERVALLAGELACAVQPNRGGFAVGTPQGRVTVSGTRFNVRLHPGRTPDGRVAEWTVVQVEEGSVSVAGEWGDVTLATGDYRRFPLPADPFAARVAALKPGERAAAVMERMKELNPGFDGRHKATVAEGEVRSLEFDTDAVADISPLKAVPYLWELVAAPSPGRPGKLNDISPLAGHWELAAVNLKSNPVDDLTPLIGKPVISAILNDTRVRDVSPFRGGPLRVLHVNGCPLRDLTPLQGLKLTELGCVPEGGRELDLTPIADAPLDRIWCAGPTGNNAAVLRRMPALRIVNDRPATDALRDR